MEKNKLKAEIKPKEQLLWEEVLKSSKNELKNTEEVYYKNKTFNEAIIKLAEEKLKRF